MTLAVKVALNPNTTNKQPTKFKVFADDKINVAQKMTSVIQVEDIADKAGDQHFLLFPQCFPSGLLNYGTVCLFALDV